MKRLLSITLAFSIAYSSYGFAAPKMTPLTDLDIRANSSAQSLKASEALVITQNDAAFETKMKAIESAVPGETIRLIYYIYSDDQSSSAFTQKLIGKANQGVQIRLMVDYLTNYKNLDLFNMMEKESNGNIKVKLYGRIPELIMRDSIFMTRPCTEVANPAANQCSKEKWSQIEREKAGGLKFDFFANLFLAGLSAKSPDALKYSLMLGQQIDPKKYDDPSKSEEQKKKEMAQLEEFFKLLFRARFKGDVGAKIKVGLAMSIHSAELNPVLNEIDGRLPITPLGEKSENDWEHLTDYTHHKLLLIGSRFMQLGGRNIENSYHMKKNKMSSKYTFDDTDFAANLNEGGQKVVESYDRMWEFSKMTIDLKNLNETVPNDIIANPQAFKQALYLCTQKIVTQNKTKADREAMGKCLQTEFDAAKPKHRDVRMAEEFSNMIAKAGEYQIYHDDKENKLPDNWKSLTDYGFQVGNSDLSNLLLTYVENLHFNPFTSSNNRIYGAPLISKNYSPEYSAGVQVKNMHYLINRGIENTCEVSSRDNKPRQIIFHTAYLILPSTVLRSIAKAIDGTLDCRNVTIRFLTNSFYTTDLNVINVYARYQLKALFDTYQNRKKLFYAYQKPMQRAAKLDYAEYIPEDPTNREQITSLHTKLTVLGDDILLGSANADVRSFYMDTNNGVYIRGASALVEQYINWVNSLTSNPKRVLNLTEYYKSSKSEVKNLLAEDEKLAEIMMERYKLASKVVKKGMTPAEIEKAQKDFAEKKAKFMGFHTDIANDVYKETNDILRFSSFKKQTNSNANNGKSEIEVQADKMDSFDRFLQLL